MMYPDFITVQGHVMSHPLKMQANEWTDDLKIWPKTEAPQVVSYLVESKACDLKQMNAYRSLESYNYLHSGWVGQVLIHKVKDDLCLLKCEVVPSQSISNTPHTAWVCAKVSGEVLIAGCTCMAGLGKVCSHAGAVLWKIDLANRLGLVGKSCTDDTSAWNRGTKRNLEPARIKDISFKKPKVHSVPVIDNQQKSKSSKDHQIQQFYCHKEVLNHIQENGLGKLFSIPGTIIQNISKAKIEQAQKNCPIERSSSSVHDHSVETSLPESCEPCSIFYDKFIKVNAQQRIEITQATVSQANSEKSLWKECRRIRLTASTSASVPKRMNTSPENFLRTKLYRPFKGDQNTMYGNEMESAARERFVSITGLNVTTCGSVISDEHNWLSASPDGVIGSNAILEIKCPRPETFDLKKVDLVRENEELKVNPKGQRGYYIQMQIAMHCTKTQYCFLFVYLGGGDKDLIVNCDFDQEFVTNLLTRLKMFYFTHFLPRMEQDHKKGILNLSEAYTYFMLKSSRLGS